MVKGVWSYTRHDISEGKRREWYESPGDVPPEQYVERYQGQAHRTVVLDIYRGDRKIWTRNHFSDRHWFFLGDAGVEEPLW